MVSQEHVGKQFSQKTPLAYLLPVKKDGTSLFVKPDVNGRAGVDVHDYDELRGVIAGKSAHEYDFDNDEFRKVRVHHWDQSDYLADGTTQRRWSYPAGGDLEHAERIS